MSGYIAVTDRDWFDFHRWHKHGEVIFWRHSIRPENLSGGTLFFFLVKNDLFPSERRPRLIEGFGVVDEIGSKTVSALWKEFGEKMGANDLNSVVDDLSKGNYIATEGKIIGYYRLKDVKFLERSLEPERSEREGFKSYVDYFAGIPFNRSIMTGTRIDALQAAELLEKIGISNEA